MREKLNWFEEKLLSTVDMIFAFQILVAMWPFSIHSGFFWWRITIIKFYCMQVRVDQAEMDKL